jgi:hypothetical protein
MNNLAELTDISIDIEDLRIAWKEQVVEAGDSIDWTYRNYVEFSFFTEYFQKILIDIENVVGEKPKDYIIQVADPSMNIKDAPKFYLNIPHKDWNRNTCINLPIYYNRMEPVNFYDEEKIEQFSGKEAVDAGNLGYGSQATGTRHYLSIPPLQTGHYSSNHPTLMNVNNFHNVRVLDELHTRIFVQMSYDRHFDEFLEKDINISVY